MQHSLRSVIKSARHCCSNRRGVVLIVVLVLVVMIALAGFGFLAAMSTEYEAVRLEGSRLQAEQTMVSAEATVLWITSLTEQQRRLVGDLHHNTALFQGRVLEPLTATASQQSTGTVDLQNLTTESALTGTQPDDRWRYSVVSFDNTSPDGPRLQFGLRNESAKLHLSSLLRWDQIRPGQGRASLLQLPGMTEALADALLDWIDADDTPREFGAESDYYMTLSQPYRAANVVPQNLEELLYVRGVTRARLFGVGQYPNIDEQSPDLQSDRDESSLQMPTTDIPIGEGISAGTADSASSSLINGGQSAEDSGYTGRFGWSEHLTVVSAERNRTPGGALKTFVNGNSLPQLEAELSRALPGSIVRFILLARQFGLQPGSADRAPTATGSTTDAMSVPFSASTPLQHPIQNLADLIDGRVQVSTASGTSVVQSPISSQSPDFSQVWSRLTRQISTIPDSIIIGRVNILQASEPVLRALPGMTAEAAAQIVSRRTEFETPPTSAGWILSENIIDLTGFRAMMPEVTMGGDVFEADIVVFRAIGGPVLRRKVQVDAASTPVRRLQWRDESSQPLPFSLSQLLPTEQTSPEQTSPDNPPRDAASG